MSAPSVLVKSPQSNKYPIENEVKNYRVIGKIILKSANILNLHNLKTAKHVFQITEKNGVETALEAASFFEKREWIRDIEQATGVLSDNGKNFLRKILGNN